MTLTASTPAKTRVIFRVVEARLGGFLLDQASNGYWWHHMTVYPTREDAEARVHGWFKADDDHVAVIDQDYVPHYMR